MKDIDVLYLEIGKIIIKRVNNEKKFYKEDNGSLFPLTIKEQKYIDSIFDNSKFDHYYSERLETLISNNNKLENKDYLINFFRFLENIIPESCKDNFYRNLETLETKFNFNADFSQVVDDEMNFSNLGSYNVKDNILNLSPASFKSIWKIAQTTSDPNDFYNNEVNSLILHELTHMASAKYNEKEIISYCGYDSYP